MTAVQSMLSAVAFGSRVAIGQEPVPELRCLSDARALQCPLCGAPVVLKAGRVVAPHFAHLPGATCSHGDAEPETDRHREGKALLARWIRASVPEAAVTLEALIAETGQRADLLFTMPDGRRVALEYQCADLSARDWRRRRDLYRSAAVSDLWVLGGNRLVRGESGYRLTELERELAAAGHPLLFVDSLGENLPAGHLARLRMEEAAPGAWVKGSVSARPLMDLLFPWRMLERAADAVTGQTKPALRFAKAPAPATPSPDTSEGDAKILRWLRLKYGAAGESLPAFFGLPTRGAEEIACSPRMWQAAVYYRWIHGRVGEAWNPDELNVWARTQLPVAANTGRMTLRSLAEYQELLAAAGFLSLPRAGGRAKVVADMATLGRIPDPDEVQRLASYRRTLRRES